MPHVNRPEDQGHHASNEEKDQNFAPESEPFQAPIMPHQGTVEMVRLLIAHH